MRRWSALAFIFILCGPVAAQGVSLSLGRPDANYIFVWKDRDSQKNAADFIRVNGANQETIDVLRQHMLACIVTKGTGAIILERVSASYKIEITDGLNKGCVGIVQQEDVP